MLNKFTKLPLGPPEKQQKPLKKSGDSPLICPQLQTQGLYVTLNFVMSFPSEFTGSRPKEFLHVDHPDHQ
jgi:hypothetical protein